MFRKGQFMPLGDNNPVSKFPFVNWILIGINVIVFLLTVSTLDSVVSAFGFTPGSFSILQIFTSMFLHGGFEHIIGNMWFLYIFGDNVEDKFGHFFYLIFYLVAGVAATFAHYLLNIGSSIPAVGASGAISGVLGAYLILFPKAGVYVSGNLGQRGQVPAMVMIGLWFVFQFVSGIGALFSTEGTGIAFWAHIGGFVFGTIFALLWKIFSRKN